MDLVLLVGAWGLVDMALDSRSKGLGFECHCSSTSAEMRYCEMNVHVMHQCKQHQCLCSHGIPTHQSPSYNTLISEDSIHVCVVMAFPPISLHYTLVKEIVFITVMSP